jgi:hypothetical protein
VLEGGGKAVVDYEDEIKVVFAESEPKAEGASAKAEASSEKADAAPAKEDDAATKGSKAPPA